MKTLFITLFCLLHFCSYSQLNDVQKQSVFTSVKTKYLLLHESGESIEISGYGHGVDSQDKAAGKATTYALKYALLYTFLVPTGKIDDADNENSDNIVTPRPTTPSPEIKNKIELTPNHKNWSGAVKKLMEGKTTIEAIEQVCNLTPENRELLITSAI
jgi:hypothetical protein